MGSSRLEAGAMTSTKILWNSISIINTDKTVAFLLLLQHFCTGHMKRLVIKKLHYKLSLNLTSQVARELQSILVLAQLYHLYIDTW